MGKIKLSIIIPLYNQEKLIIRALESIPDRDDIEVIVMDDASTDNSFDEVLNYSLCNENKNIALYGNYENMGVGYTINEGIKNCEGEYFCILCSDDYYLEDIGKLIDELDGTDLVYYNLRINDGTIIELNDETKHIQVGATKAHRRVFVGNTQRSDKRLGGDKDFYEELMLKNPTEKFTNIVLYHYNHPREGSLLDEMLGGKN